MPHGCVSTGGGIVTTAAAIQVRWRTEDLPVLETPPLTAALPPRQRHFGWEPATALTTVHTLAPSCYDFAAQSWATSGGKATLLGRPYPSDCTLPAKDSYIGYFETRPAPIEGALYYSPAVCPWGYTAAFTRPVLGDWGPPEEPEETAMYCCPRSVRHLRYPSASDGVVAV